MSDHPAILEAQINDYIDKWLSHLSDSTPIEFNRSSFEAPVFRDGKGRRRQVDAASGGLLVKAIDTLYAETRTDPPFIIACDSPWQLVNLAWICDLQIDHPTSLSLLKSLLRKGFWRGLWEKLELHEPLNFIRTGKRQWDTDYAENLPLYLAQTREALHRKYPQKRSNFNLTHLFEEAAIGDCFETAQWESSLRFLVERQVAAEPCLGDRALTQLYESIANGRIGRVRNSLGRAISADLDQKNDNDLYDVLELDSGNESLDVCSFFQVETLLNVHKQFVEISGAAFLERPDDGFLALFDFAYKHLPVRLSRFHSELLEAWCALNHGTFCYLAQPHVI